MRATLQEGVRQPVQPDAEATGGPLGKSESPSVALTVIMPVYNAARTLERAVESVFAQTMQDFEIVACDDCSQDASPQLLAELAGKDKRLRFVTGEVNRGPGAARNQALALATGRWVAVLDADDWYAPDRLERLVRLGDTTSADFVVDNQFMYDAGAGRVVGIGLPPSEGFERIGLDDLLLNSLTGRAQYDYGLLQPVIRRAFMVEHGIRYTETCRFGEDFLLALDCLAAGAQGVLSFRPMYYVTQPYGWRSGLMSRPDRQSYDLANMKCCNDMAVNRYREKITPRQLRLLERRSRSIELYARYVSVTAGGFRKPWKIFAALCRPSLWPYFGKALARKGRVMLSTLP